jgi:hypothetical protein
MRARRLDNAIRSRTADRATRAALQASTPRLTHPLLLRVDGAEDSGYSAAAAEPARSSKRMRSNSPDMQHPAPESRQPLPPLQQHDHQQ